MRKIVSLLLLLVLLVGLVGCSSNQKSEEELKAEIKAEMEAEAKLKEELKEEVKAEMEAEQKGKEEKEQLKQKQGEQEQVEEESTKKEDATQGNGVHDLDSVFEFIVSVYPEYTKEDFAKWTPNFLDLNADGNDEVIFTTTYGDGNLDDALVITADQGEFKIIPSWIPLAKYENDMSFKDGFLVHNTKIGGSGAYAYYMDLYFYDGYKLVNTLNGSIMTKEEVAMPNADYITTSEIKGNLQDFVITLTKKDNQAGKEEIIAQNKYEYDENLMYFRSKPLSLSNTAKSFDQVYTGNNFLETIKYFADNLYYFDENGLKDFSVKMMQVIEQDRDKIFPPMGMSVLEGIANESFNFDNNELAVSNLQEDVKEILKYLESREIYRLAKLFYANEGDIQDLGFRVAIDPWVFEMLKPAFHVAYPDIYSPEDYNNLNPLLAPNFSFHSVKQVENSQIAYPNIYVYSYEDVKKLEGAETWKSNIILPVETVEN